LDYGVVSTPKQESLPTRLVLLEDGINQILRKYRPDQIAMEELFFSKNITTGIAVAHARGVALLACVKYCPYLYEYTPMQIKQALTGYGRAEKAQMQQVVATMLGLEKIPKPDDAADALAIALCHATASRFGGLFKVENMTRTKGKNTEAGNAFQQLMQEAAKKQDKKERKKATATAKPKKITATATTKTTAKKAVAPVKQPPRLNTASEIARKIAAQMQSADKKGE
jgi:crossover junction endodeoxyribonuclease RuvC